MTELSENITKKNECVQFSFKSSLNNPGTSAKTYWTILTTFYSGKKIPVIPPLVKKDQLILIFEKYKFYNLYLKLYL